MNEVRCRSYEDDDLLAWVLGDMPDGDERALTHHLSECSMCCERTAEYRRLERSAGACRKGDVIRWRRFESPFGVIRIASSRQGLVALSWQAPDDGAFVERLEKRYDTAPVVCDCDDAACGLGFGEVATYTDIADRIGSPKASRAVGNALGSNPVAIVVPCHRVIRTDGSLGGYTGGLQYKEALLDIEGRTDLLGEPELFQT